ncbi:MAG: small basic protein [Planctomycetes bacterium]|jgi:small basic protein (TIGR04137 family)|nr:small basic protein [Planctomycetota bacterium]HPY75056.1 small basic protein [Planctomycetota bacterium]HQB00717.1 small basic protein [Planctomycetota bacterium]HRU50723.1 small basic protein [Planctomycetota bacterium]
MSIHKSLRVGSTLKRYRNVLKRTERVVLMQERGTWKEGDSVYGLPKMRAGFKMKKSKGKSASAATTGKKGK